MAELTIFSGIALQDRESMIRCFLPSFKSFRAGETIATMSPEPQRIGIVTRGRARLSCLDAAGNLCVLEVLGEDSVFGEIFAVPIDGQEYIVEAETDCRVMFIGYDCVVKRCENACPHHSRLVSNLFHMAAHKAGQLSLHISILSQRTLRQKLLAYFGFIAKSRGSDEFDIPMTMTELSDYLFADRSAMMREIGNMRAEGLIEYSSRHVKLL